LDANMLKTAESLGIPLNAILKYVSDLQDYNKQSAVLLKAIFTNFSAAVKAEVGAIVKEAQDKNQAQLDERKKAEEEFMRTHPEYQGRVGGGSPQAGAPSGVGGIMNLLNNPVVSQLAGAFGGGGGNGGHFQEMAEKFFMDAATQSLAFSKTFNEAVLNKLGGKMVNEVLEGAAKAATA